MMNNNLIQQKQEYNNSFNNKISDLKYLTKQHLLAVILWTWITTNVNALSLWFENITSEVTHQDVSSSIFSWRSIKTHETVEHKVHEIYIDKTVLPWDSYIEVNNNNGSFKALYLDMQATNISSIDSINYSEHSEYFSIQDGRYIRIDNFEKLYKPHTYNITLKDTSWANILYSFTTKVWSVILDISPRVAKWLSDRVIQAIKDWKLDDEIVQWLLADPKSNIYITNDEVELILDWIISQEDLLDLNVMVNNSDYLDIIDHTSSWVFAYIWKTQWSYLVELSNWQTINLKDAYFARSKTSNVLQLISTWWSGGHIKWKDKAGNTVLIPKWNYNYKITYLWKYTNEKWEVYFKIRKGTGWTKTYKTWEIDQKVKNEYEKRIEQEAQRKAEEARKKAEQEAKRKQEEEAKRKQEEERLREAIDNVGWGVWEIIKDIIEEAEDISQMIDEKMKIDWPPESISAPWVWGWLDDWITWKPWETEEKISWQEWVIWDKTGNSWVDNQVQDPEPIEKVEEKIEKPEETKEQIKEDTKEKVQKVIVSNKPRQRTVYWSPRREEKVLEPVVVNNSRNLDLEHLKQIWLSSKQFIKWYWDWALQATKDSATGLIETPGVLVDIWYWTAESMANWFKRAWKWLAVWAAKINKEIRNDRMGDLVMEKALDDIENEWRKVNQEVDKFLSESKEVYESLNEVLWNLDKIENGEYWWGYVTSYAKVLVAEWAALAATTRSAKVSWWKIKWSKWYKKFITKVNELKGKINRFEAKMEAQKEILKTSLIPWLSNPNRIRQNKNKIEEAVLLYRENDVKNVSGLYHVNYWDWDNGRLTWWLHNMGEVEKLLEKWDIRVAVKKDGDNNWWREVDYNEYASLDEDKKLKVKITTYKWNTIINPGRWPRHMTKDSSLFPSDFTEQDIIETYVKTEKEIKNILLKKYWLPEYFREWSRYWKNAPVRKLENYLGYKEMGPYNYKLKKEENIKTKIVWPEKPLKKESTPIIHKIKLDNWKEIELEIWGKYDETWNLDFQVETLYPNY